MCGKKNIVVSGYPKSGNTWMTRLIAEALNSPVRGFYGQPSNNEISIEGNDRNGKFNIYKSHHTSSELSGIQLRIFIVRDPRQVVLSGSFYFDLYKYRIGDRIQKFLRRISSKIYNMLGIKQKRQKLMTKIVVKGRGANKPDNFLRRSWNTFYRDVSSEEIIVKYESLLLAPQIELKRIFGELGIKCNEVSIQRAVERQSMSYRKTQAEAQRDKIKLSFLREGKADSWKDELSVDLQTKIEESCSDQMIRFSYEKISQK